MRCLNCRCDGIARSTSLCPQCGVHLPSLMRDVLPAGTLLNGGKYHVDYPLGRGGFGVTYRAIHTGLEQIVAVKEFFPQEHAHRDGQTGMLHIANSQKDAYSRGISRFMDEGRIMTRISHAGIVRVQDLFEERGTAYLVMELVPGRTLRDELDAHADKRLSEQQVKMLMQQLVNALGALHERNIFHLDIKPDNILVAPDGRAFLIDFGAARLGFHSRSTQAYTLEYVAPEIVARHDVGSQSDLFELGMVLHEMLTGEVPPSALSRLMKDDWQPTKVSPEWKTIIASALQLSVDKRAQNVQVWWDAASNGSTPQRADEKQRQIGVDEPWRVVRNALKEKTPLECIVRSHTTGGLIVSLDGLGLEAFVPSYHISRWPFGNRSLSHLKGHEFVVLVTQIDESEITTSIRLAQEILTGGFYSGSGW